MTIQHIRRVGAKVSLDEARKRLKRYRNEHGIGPHKAAWLAYEIWPDANFLTAQGAGRSAVHMLKRLGCVWTATGNDWGWLLTNL